MICFNKITKDLIQLIHIENIRMMKIIFNRKKKKDIKHKEIIKIINLI